MRSTINKTLTGTVLFLALLLTGCAEGASQEVPAAQPVQLVASDIAYDQSTIEAVAGRPVALDFRNQGVLPHDFTIDHINVQVANAGGHDAHGDAHGGAEEADLHFHLEANESGNWSFTPQEAGTYQFYCSVPGHREAGMVGTLIVTESQQ